MRPGGAAVNVALALARRGLSVGLAGVVGDDALGEALAQRVASAGVRAAFDHAIPRTGVLFAERRDDGARFVGYRPGDEPAPRPPSSMTAPFVLITGLLPSLDHARALREIAQSARARGAAVFVDVNARPRLWRGRDAEAVRGVIAAADVVKTSEEDRRFAMIDDGAPSTTWITTSGGGPVRARGAFGEVLVEPAGEARGAVLGAGDAFMAGLLLDQVRRGRANDARSWERALRAGCSRARAHLAGQAREPRRIAR